MSLDSSSSACKAFLIDSSGKICRSCSFSIRSESLREGWCEQDPIEIWENQFLALKSLISDIPKESILGISISNQRESIIAWDKDTLKPIYNLISWQDRRDDKFEVKFAEYRDLIKDKTGLYINNYFSAAKIRWILANVKYPIEKLRVGTVDCWLLANLTDGTSFYTDITNASRTLLFNLKTEQWDDELLDLFEIPKHILPEVKPSANLFGYWNEIPILGMIGDQQAALLSLGGDDFCLNCTYGTGLFLLLSTGNQMLFGDKLVTTSAWKIDKSNYALETGSYLCGNLLDSVFGKKNLSELIKTMDVEEKFFIDSRFKKVFFFDDRSYDSISDDVTLNNSSWEKLAKSYVNTIALITYQLINQNDLFRSTVSLNVSGGLSNLRYLNQLVADLTGIKVLSHANKDRTALGAAYLVFLHLNILTFGEIKKNNLKESEEFFPNLSNVKSNNLLNIWKSRLSHL